MGCAVVQQYFLQTADHSSYRVHSAPHLVWIVNTFGPCLQNLLEGSFPVFPKPLYWNSIAYFSNTLPSCTELISSLAATAVGLVSKFGRIAAGLTVNSRVFILIKIYFWKILNYWARTTVMYYSLQLHKNQQY